MTPRTIKLNAHRSLTYYTPEDVAELLREIDQRRILAEIGDSDLTLARRQRDSAEKTIRMIVNADSLYEVREILEEEGWLEQSK